jgi:hypothetical protein
MEAPVQDRSAIQGGVMVVRRGEEGVFRWQAIEGADHYRFNFYKGNPGSGALVYSNQKVDAVSVSLSMDNYGEGNYYWTVQGYTEESASGTARTGLIAETNFTLRKTTPSAQDSASAANSALPASASSAANSVTAPAAQASVAQPTAEQTLTAAGRTPANNTVFNADYFRSNSSIVFGWNNVNGAESYIFTLYQQTAEGRRRILNESISTLSYGLSNLSVLDRGSFVWTVTPVRGNERGPASENRFTVDIPQVQKTQLQNAGTMYGGE